MATWEMISAKEAPPQPRVVSSTRQFSLDVITSLKKGDVAQIEPEEGETTRGLRVSVGRAATELNKKVMSYVVDDKLYVKLA